MFKTKKNKRKVFIDLNIIVLLKMEIIKFILLYNIYFKENKDTKKNICTKGLNKSLNFFLTLKFHSEEIKILEKNINNKFFTYNILRNNRVFKEILKKFIKNPEKNEYIFNKIPDTNLINKILTLKLTFNKYDSFYTHLQTIKDNYNFILKTKLIYVELDYKKILDFYPILFEVKKKTEFKEKDEVKEKPNISQILKEDLNIYYISSFTLNKEDYNSVEKNIQVLNDLQTMNVIANTYINAETDEIKEVLIKKLNILKDKIL